MMMLTVPRNGKSQRHWSGVSRPYGGIGAVANHSGVMNLKNKQLDIGEKYEILKDADFVLDGLLTVSFHIYYLY